MELCFLPPKQLTCSVTYKLGRLELERHAHTKMALRKWLHCWKIHEFKPFARFKGRLFSNIPGVLEAGRSTIWRAICSNTFETDFWMTLLFRKTCRRVPLSILGTGSMEKIPSSMITRPHISMNVPKKKVLMCTIFYRYFKSGVTFLLLCYWYHLSDFFSPLHSTNAERCWKPFIKRCVCQITWTMIWIFFQNLIKQLQL